MKLLSALLIAMTPIVVSPFIVHGAPPSKQCRDSRGRFIKCPPPPPPTQVCPDGSVIPATQACPQPIPSPLQGEASIADNFDPNLGIEPFDNGGSQQGSLPPVSPEEVGAFRMSCAAGHLAKDDPIVYPGQPGASHLHQFWGNTLTNASSNYSSLRTIGGTTCGSPNSAPINRTAYWMPAMLDGVGNAVKPYFINTYYKQFPANDPRCGKGCLPLPNGLKFVYGYNMKTMSGGPNDPLGANIMRFECWADDIGTPAVAGFWHNLADVAKAGCPVGARLNIFGFAPDCWDGQHTDSADHRSHMTYGDAGICPADHPYKVPQWMVQVRFVVDANFAKWLLSSDQQMAQQMGTPVVPGSTLHFDYFEAWSPLIKQRWQTKCIDAHLTCSGGELGDGTVIKEISHDQTHILVPVM
jgi:hypothetical protein